MEEGEADLDPGCDWETPPARDLGRPFLSGVPEGRPPPGPASDDFRGRAEKYFIINNLKRKDIHFSFPYFIFNL